jgi:hypothetical protein
VTTDISSTSLSESHISAHNSQQPTSNRPTTPHYPDITPSIFQVSSLRHNTTTDNLYTTPTNRNPLPKYECDSDLGYISDYSLLYDFSENEETNGHGNLAEPEV